MEKRLLGRIARCGERGESAAVQKIELSAARKLRLRGMIRRYPEKVGATMELTQLGREQLGVTLLRTAPVTAALDGEGRRRDEDGTERVAYEGMIPGAYWIRTTVAGELWLIDPWVANDPAHLLLIKEFDIDLGASVYRTGSVADIDEPMVTAAGTIRSILRRLP